MRCRRLASVAKAKGKSMKEIKFTGSLSEVHKKAEEWKASMPHVKIIQSGPPIRVGYLDRHDVLKKTDWSTSIKYEDQPAN